MRLMFLSDTHGNLPELDVDGIDIVLHCGDYTGHFERDDIAGQLGFFENQFCPWVRRLLDRVPHFYYVNGNHEFFIEQLSINGDYNDVTKKCCIDMSEVYLSEYNIRVFGFPYTPTFGRWGFNLDDTPEELGRKSSFIPANADIVISHGPVYGMNDLVPGKTYYDGRNNRWIDIPPLRVGSKEINKRIDTVRPKIFASGHIHHEDNYGVKECDSTKFVGCCVTDSNYTLCRRPIIIDL